MRLVLDFERKGNGVSDIVSFMEKTARKAGARAVELFGHVESEPKGRSIVSRADREVERIIIEEIRAAYSDDPVLAEESGVSGAGDIGPDTRWWAIDPIDGTGPYLKGLPFWAVSIACLRGSHVEAGVVHMPAMGDTFTAGSSGPAMRNGAPLPQSRSGSAHRARLSLRSVRRSERPFASLPGTLSGAGLRRLPYMPYGGGFGLWNLDGAHTRV